MSYLKGIFQRKNTGTADGLGCFYFSRAASRRNGYPGGGPVGLILPPPGFPRP